MKHHSVTVLFADDLYRVGFDGRRALAVWLKLDPANPEHERAVDRNGPLGRYIVTLARARLAMEGRSRRSRSRETLH